MEEIDKELKELQEKEYKYNIEKVKKSLHGLTNELYGLFKRLYCAFHFTEDQFITEKEKKILKEIIDIEREEAFCTTFCGVSPHEIRESMRRTEVLINKYIEICIKDLLDNQTITHQNNDEIVYKLKV